MTTVTNPFESLPIDTASQDVIPATSEVQDVPVYDAVNYDASGYDSSSYDASGYDAGSYDATVKDLTGDQLVSGQLDTILDKDGVLMDVARSAGDEYSNARGALGSSMGAQASTRAMIDSALPIAQQDASSQLSQLQTNQQYENTASQFNTEAENVASQFNTAAENTASQFNSAAENEAGRFNSAAENDAGQFNSAADNAAAQFNTTNEVQQLRDSILQSYQLQMENLSTNNKALLIDLEQKYSAAIQSDKNASDVYASTMDEIGKLMSTKDLTAEQQDAGMGELVSMLDAYLDFNFNLSSVDSVYISGDAVRDARISDAELSAQLASVENIVKEAEYNSKVAALGERPVELNRYSSDDYISYYDQLASVEAGDEWDAAIAALDTEYRQWL